MKPILLQGSERSTTQIKYNGERDLLFSVSKDPQESEARTKVSARGSDLIFRNPCRKTTHTLNSTNQSSRPFQPLRPVPKHLHLQHTLQEKKVLTSLQRDIIIQPADKGRCAVILNTSDCFEILFGLLNTKYSLGSMF